MKKKLMLAMSGGVDSSAALALLCDKYDVIGGTLQLCGDTDFSDARRVAEKFGIQHYIFSKEELFRKHVMDDFVQTYFDGGTPNPCIQCNRYIKFGALLEEALALGCEYLATGHYARVEFDPDSGRYLLKKALSADGSISSKDQSYVLYSLTQEQLRHVILPLGCMDKAQVRELALSKGLVNAAKPDSQDICFVPDGDYAGFIKRYSGVSPRTGSFTDSEGNILGSHKGLIHYTIGQRKGLGISFGKPMFVIDKDPVLNTVILGEGEQLMKSSLTAADVNFISIEKLTSPLSCKAKTRYSQAEQPCVISPLSDGRVMVEFEQPQRAITKGQSVVFYDGDTVIGGGIIE